MPAAAHATAAAATGAVSRNHGRSAGIMCGAAAKKIRERPRGVLLAAVRAVYGLIRVCHRAQLIETGAAIGAIIFVQGHV